MRKIHLSLTLYRKYFFVGVHRLEYSARAVPENRTNHASEAFNFSQDK